MRPPLGYPGVILRIEGSDTEAHGTCNAGVSGSIVLEETAQLCVAFRGMPLGCNLGMLSLDVVDREHRLVVGSEVLGRSSKRETEDIILATQLLAFSDNPSPLGRIVLLVL